MANPRPTLARERAAWAEEQLLVGIDEVGRGPLAGPVVAAAVVFPAGCRFIRGVRDSKILPGPKREELALAIRCRALAFGVGAASVREIDRLNIRVASALAMRRALARLLSSAGARVRPESIRIVIDGLPLPELGYVHEALVDGDVHCHSIAAAAIVAKTVRDELMRRLAARHPGYGWETNVGYGTVEHHDGLRSHGTTRHHRISFGPVAQLSLLDALLNDADSGCASGPGREIELEADGGRDRADGDRADGARARLSGASAPAEATLRPTEAPPPPS